MSTHPALDVISGFRIRPSATGNNTGNVFSVLFRRNSVRTKFFRPDYVVDPLPEK